MAKKYFACVYGGASERLENIYKDAARKLGQIVTDNGFSLVYGAGATGCMGAVAEGVKQAGGYVMGVAPHFIGSFEEIFRCDNTVMVDTMNERKLIMEKHADVYFILPGGIGTMDEFFQIITLKYLRQCFAPVVVLNINGFYGSLISLIDDIVENRAANGAIKSLFDVADAVDDGQLAKYFKKAKNE